MVAYNRAGIGAASDNVVFFSQQLVPTKVPGNIQSTQLNASSVNITWTPLTLFEARGFPQYVVTLFVPSAVRQQRRQTNHFTVTTNNSFAVFTNLKSGSFQLLIGVSTGNGSDVINTDMISGKMLL